MPTYEVLIERNGPVTTVIINRPEARNACTMDTAKALYDAFMAFESDERARVAVLAGQGDCFCAGADLQELASGKYIGEGTYRLLTEAEWEYVAPAGSDMAFADGGITERGSDREPNLEATAWYCYNSSNRAHPVGRKDQILRRLYDMHGNVREWCQDWYGQYPPGSVIDPSGPGTAYERVARGGGWLDHAGDCRSAGRSYLPPNYIGWDVGFRLIRDAP